MTPRPRTSLQEALRIAFSLTAVCALGALILGGVYLGTERYAEAAREEGEQRAVVEMLGLCSDATVTEVRQYLSEDAARVLYRTVPEAGGLARELVFSLDGALLRSGTVPEAASTRGLEPLGRVFVARRYGQPAGFLIEGEARGYKNRIRFFVALGPEWTIQGVRVLEHEEDPGLGAEVATPWFEAQYSGRPLGAVPKLDVTKDPMPEDWRAALRELGRLAPSAWQEKYSLLRLRESDRPIYAVTGATISSRALTDGVRATVLHFRKRWELIEPHLDTDAREAAR